MSDQKVTVEDLIDGAIIAGFQRGSHAYLEGLEDQLRTSLIIQESGDAASLLQQMIDESENATVTQMTNEHLQELDGKLRKVLG